MASVRKTDDGVTLSLTDREAKRLFDLLYVVESSDSPNALYAQLLDLEDLMPILSTTAPNDFSDIAAHSVAIVKDVENTNARFIRYLEEALPDGASVHTVTGEANIVLSVALPR